MNFLISFWVLEMERFFRFFFFFYYLQHDCSLLFFLLCFELIIKLLITIWGFENSLSRVTLPLGVDIYTEFYRCLVLLTLFFWLYLSFNLSSKCWSKFFDKIKKIIELFLFFYWASYNTCLWDKLEKCHFLLLTFILDCF